MRKEMMLEEEISIEWKSIDECPVCGNDKKHFYWQGKWGGTLYINFWICKCGIVYADRQPANDIEIDKYYRDYYTKITEGHWGIEGPGGLKEREKDRAYRLMAGNLALLRPARHLDIGCCYGGLMDMLSEELGCVSEGCDIRNLAEGHKVYKTLDEVDGPYDLVTCIHTLEHTPDPVGYLEAIRKICSGTLFIEVPSFAPLTGVLSPHHLFGFTVHTLHDIVENAGFKVIEVGQAVHGNDKANKVELQIMAKVENE